MRSTKTLRPARLFFTVSLLFLAACAAQAAARVIEDDATTGGFWAAFVAVQVLSALGYAASSLPRWAGWPDGTAETRLALVSSAISALLAGNAGYYGGFYYAGLSQVACLGASVGGGFLGEKVLTPLFNRLFTAAVPGSPGQKPPNNP